MWGKFSVVFTGLKMDGKHWQASVLDKGCYVKARGATPSDALSKLMDMIGMDNESRSSTEGDGTVAGVESSGDESGDGTK